MLLLLVGHNAIAQIETKMERFGPKLPAQEGDFRIARDVFTKSKGGIRNTAKSSCYLQSL